MFLVNLLESSSFVCVLTILVYIAGTSTYHNVHNITKKTNKSFYEYERTILINKKLLLHNGIKTTEFSYGQ